MMLSQVIRGVEDRSLYQVMFLKNDRRQDVYVEEVEEIDFEELRRHLERGESVFITSRPEQKLCTFKEFSKELRKVTR
jgi:hypothetical protein